VVADRSAVAGERVTEPCRAGLAGGNRGAAQSGGSGDGQRTGGEAGSVAPAETDPVGAFTQAKHVLQIAVELELT
jgi:hypothetical protein